MVTIGPAMAGRLFYLRFSQQKTLEAKGTRSVGLTRPKPLELQISKKTATRLPEAQDTHTIHDLRAKHGHSQNDESEKALRFTMNVCNRNLNLGNDMSSVMTVNSKVQRALPLVVLLGESQAWLPVVRAIQQTEQSAACTNPRTLMFGNSIK
jgi:hypothetical protein